MIFDNQQQQIKQQLDAFALKINAKKSIFSKIFATKNNFKSLYLYGGPGCGKTTLLKYFYQHIAVAKKYYHFHAFMQKVHQNMHKKHQDIASIIGDAKIICFDEFQIVDIADAMLLKNIFAYFFANNIAVVFTSNFHPLQLYQNGLQRQYYLDFVNSILIPNCDFLLLDSSIDYRLAKNNIRRHYFIANIKNRQKFSELLLEFSKNMPATSTKINVWQRELLFKKTYGNVASITFSQLCRNNLAADDYRAICNHFDLLFIKTVPRFFEADINALRRFCLLIDEAYESKIALVILAKTKPEFLCQMTNQPQYFARTVSRLQEIAGNNYWLNSKINNINERTTQ